MSKVSEAKAAQGWRKKPHTCAGCRHFALDRVEELVEWSNTSWIREKNLRCSLGGFKTGKSNICDRFEQARLEQ
ncbi:TPA: hypothetical protein ACXM9H_000990 [Burkholderia multivorans]|uniref:hypothetical protein n=1 Tax=Burkholderia multivorans TaxID=87883 RepID=UPI000D01010D|nr:hypothetical protein [Burkholderia multivorans]PRD74776.1 hypothetical protein C6P75_12345 [Burkholderia multivorans]